MSKPRFLGVSYAVTGLCVRRAWEAEVRRSSHEAAAARARLKSLATFENRAKAKILMERI